VLVHLAARVHVMQDAFADPLTEFRKVNVAGTENLARQAAKAGVKRFVFLSSIKVNGEFTEAGQPFTADDVPAPEDPYGISKHEAERLLLQIAAETGMEVVIIRPPLVYGPCVKANFESMMRWLARGVPLPLAAVTQNRRSLLALDNLVDLIVTCLHHPAAANQTFLVSDGEDLSTAQLLKRMGSAMGRPARLFHMPPALMKLGATLLNKRAIYQRLCGSLQLDIAKTRQLLGWTPPVSVDQGLRRAAEGFRP
jgi:nucleoside-diphosphate-sugar epimerase